ncbi:MAG: chromosomal replication initiator protein DnaA, partial [Acidobacteria bacterium]|nr:chromosomal replication initiator protein DnaA [Acidobacteriota bacterium]
MPAAEIPTLEERLHSRFEWGLIADLEPPESKQRSPFSKRKADMDGIELADDIAMYMARHCQDQRMRELEGS